jgi:hypothetical protein
MDVTEKENHQIILRANSKGELQDKISNFFLDHYDDLHVVDITFGDNEATVLYEWLGVRKK